MSINLPSLTSVDGTLLVQPDEWEHLRRDTVFRATDERINTLHKGTTRSLRTKRGRGATFDEQMYEDSPFPDETDIRYELELNQNIDPEDSESLDWDALDAGKDEGNLYQFNLNESLVKNHDLEEEVIQGHDLGNTDIDCNLLELHGIIYEEENGRRHLMHWDPGIYDSEGEKHKYKEDNSSPDLMEVAEKEENMFESYETRGLEDGLEHIYDELIEGSERIESAANRESLENSGQDAENLDYSEQVLEDAWNAERWRGMADAVKTFSSSVQEGYGQRERISF